MFKLLKILTISLFVLFSAGGFGQTAEQVPAENQQGLQLEGGAVEADLAEADSIFTRITDSGPVVFMVLIILIGLSILSWAVAIMKHLSLKNLDQENKAFLNNFWESRTLNDLNSRLTEISYSPAKEVFRVGYSELVKAKQMRENSTSPSIVIKATMDNLGRALRKSRIEEKRKMERMLPILSTTASASPFIGLFGTVWGIMGAFEGIAATGNASLAAVAPGISEALIATAFGLAAAIPAVIGYNMAVNKIRGLSGSVESFGAEFMNLVERYLLTEKAGTKPQATSGSTQSPGI